MTNIENLEELKAELAKAEAQWREWEEEEEALGQPGKHALGFNALSEEISDLQQEIEALENQQSSTEQS